MKMCIGLLTIIACLVLAPLAQAGTIDATTSGAWIGTYGADGYILPDYMANSGAWDGPIVQSKDLASLPSYVAGYSYSAATGESPDPAGPYAYKWGSGIPSGHAWFSYSAQDPRSVGDAYREACAAYYAVGSMKVSLTLAANSPSFQMAVYAFDFGGDDRIDHGRSETIATQWQGEAAAFDSALLSGYFGGKYAVFNINPNGKTQLDIIVTPSAGTLGAETNLQGIMFSSVPEPGTLTLVATGLVGLLAYAWRRRK